MANRQLIISVSREYGSGGHEIAEKLANHYEIKLYDRNILDEIARKKNGNVELMHLFDEKHSHTLLKRTVRGMSSSAADNLAEMQFDFIEEKADDGESFVIVGRCSEAVLSDNPNLISIFITGDADVKLRRIMELYDIPEDEAKSKISRHDTNRKKYHNSHCSNKWGDSRHYNLCINSSPLGVEGTVKTIVTMIDQILSREG